MIFLPKPVMSDALLANVQRAQAMHHFVLQQMPDSFQGEEEKNFLCALYSIVEEHHAAILYLLQANQFDGSAFTLARPLADSAYRAHWIILCAPADRKLALFNGKGSYPKLKKMAEDVSVKIAQAGFLHSLAPYINALNEFTHGGMHQLVRRFDENGKAKPSYLDTEKSWLLTFTTMHFVGLSLPWCQLASGTKEEAELRSYQITSKYLELYGK